MASLARPGATDVVQSTIANGFSGVGRAVDVHASRLKAAAVLDGGDVRAIKRDQLDAVLAKRLLSPASAMPLLAPP